MTGTQTNGVRDGVYLRWEWQPIRKCWEASIPLRIYPHDDGSFTVSTSEVWHNGDFSTFEAAEAECCSDNVSQTAPATADAGVRVSEEMGAAHVKADVEAEMARIRNLFTPSDSDKEDLITYAKSVVSLRAALRVPAPTGEGVVDLQHSLNLELIAEVIESGRYDSLIKKEAARQLREAASALARAGDGWRLVPERPTWEREGAGRDVLADDLDEDAATYNARDAYIAMLAAAPTPPSGKED